MIKAEIVFPKDEQIIEEKMKDIIVIKQFEDR